MGAVEAIEALAARRDRPDDDALADRVFVAEPAAEFLDDADRLVAEHEARLDRVLAANDVHVGPADRRGRDANHGLSPSRRRLRHLLDGDAVLLPEYDGFHGCHGMSFHNGLETAG